MLINVKSFEKLNIEFILLNILIYIKMSQTETSPIGQN